MMTSDIYIFNRLDEFLCFGTYIDNYSVSIINACCFVQVYDDLPDITLDVPPAHAVLEKLVKKCLADKIIPEDVAKKMPIR